MKQEFEERREVMAIVVGPKPPAKVSSCSRRISREPILKDLPNSLGSGSSGTIQIGEGGFSIQCWSLIFASEITKEFHGFPFHHCVCALPGLLRKLPPICSCAVWQVLQNMGAEDVQVTASGSKTAGLLGMFLVDHIVVGKSSRASLMERGLGLDG